MRRVLHYKTKYLNKSETFIDRLVRNHQEYAPSVLCYEAKSFIDGLPVYESPKKGVARLTNMVAFHLNLPLPYYTSTIRELQPDVIHAHFGYDAYKLIGPAQKNNVPLVVSFYGSDVSRLPSEFGWQKRYKKLADAGSHFIAATEFMKGQLIDLGFPEDKITVVPFGINLSDFSFREDYNPTDQVMMIGRMVEKKGFEYAIRAVSELQKRDQPVTLNLFGDGPLRDDLENLAKKLELNGQVHFHGYRPISEIMQKLDEHSVLLAPSVTAEDGDKEGLPNTILEGMAKGIPVVATKHAAIPEAIQNGKTGFLTHERNIEQISDKISYIIQGADNIDEIRSAARKYIEEHHSVKRMVYNAESIYKSVK